MNKIDKWKIDIKKISDDVTNLVENRFIYNQIVGITKANSTISHPNVFWDFFKNNYVASQVLSICNQVDSDKDSLSLLNLLNEIFNNPELVTKEWYCQVSRIMQNSSII